MNTIIVTMGQPSVNDAEEIIARLKAGFHLAFDSELAAKLMISGSSVANGRNRDSVPPRYQRIAAGKVNWGAFTSGGTSEMSDIERAAMLRLMRDFGDIATDYGAFLRKSGNAAASWRKYWSVA